MKPTLFLALSLILTAPCSRAQIFADTVVVHGKIWTENPQQTEAEALAIVGNHILSVGSSTDILKLAGPATKIIELNGKRVVPGFNDSHVHFIDGGRGLASVQLRDAASQAEFAERISRFARTQPKGTWILEGNWDHERWTPAVIPTHELIDDFTPENPVMVWRLDHHMVLANALAMKLAGITRDTKDVPGGVIVRDAQGNPTGIFKDAAVPLIASAIPPATAQQLRTIIEAAETYAAENGVTSVQDVIVEPATLGVYQQLMHEDALHLRISAHQPLAAWQRLAAPGILANFGNDTLHIGALKGFADGSLGSTTAWFFKPYLDAPNTSGIPSKGLSNPEQMYADIKGADQAGLQIAIHAIGDRANNTILNFYERVEKENGPRDRRFRIEHAQHLLPADIPRFASLHVIASMQPYHAIDDGRWAAKRIDAERIKTTYAFRSLLDSGATLAFGSDWPVAPMVPLLGIYAAATRRTLDDKNPEGWVPEQKISVAEAVHAYTVGSAFAEKEESVKGSLSAGKLADLVVLSDDIFHIDPILIEKAKVDTTIFGGKVIYERSPAPLRLSTDVRPARYKATLDITPGSDSFKGEIEIAIDVVNPTSEITLHAKEIEFQSVTPTPSQIRKGENDLVTLLYDKPFAAGPMKLTIAYTGAISRVLTDGAFQQKHAGDWYVFTKFEPITARRVFPCFDEPGYKVPWQLTLIVPTGLKAFSNTPLAVNESMGAITKMGFQETKPLPSYLVAFAVGPFDVVDTAPVGRNHVPSRIAVPKGRGAEAEYAASVTPKLIEMLESYFGTPYPYEKLDQVVVPLTTAWGAMENAGMIAYGDFLLAPKTQDSELRHQSTSLTMEHEMSHQWFGDLVTMQWWNDLWLNEAFASWVSNKLVADWHPEWRINEKRAASTAIFRADSLTTARKIRQPIEAAGDIGTAFDGITYGKGQAVIGMFEHYVGDKPFQQGVREYLKAHAFGNATSDDLMSALDKVSPASGVGDAFKSYLNQVGFPVVSVTVDCSSKPQVRLTQVRMVPKGSTANENATWGVPVCLAWDKGSKCVLLKQAAQSFDLGGKTCPSSVFADSGAAGYYASTYSGKVALDRLTPSEKAAYARNVRVLFSSGVGDLAKEFQTAAAFSQDTDSNLIEQSAALLGSVNDLVPPESQNVYATRIRQLYGKRAHELSWRPKAADTPEIRSLRASLVGFVATNGADAELATEARQLADAWLKDRSSLEAEMVSEVLSTAAYNGGRDFFDELAAALRTTKIQRERSWIIAGISGFRDAAIAESALQLIGAPGIDARETSRLLFSAHAETRETVWQYVQANFDKLNATLPSARGVPFAATLPGAASGFCDAGHAAEAETFFKPRVESMPGGSRNLASALERIRLCAAQAEVAKPAVMESLAPKP